MYASIACKVLKRRQQRDVTTPLLAQPPLAMPVSLWLEQGLLLQVLLLQVLRQCWVRRLLRLRRLLRRLLRLLLQVLLQ